MTPPPQLCTDARLRRYGWTIYSRPEVGPALWIRGGIVRTEAQAAKICGLELEQVGLPAKKTR